MKRILILIISLLIVISICACTKQAAEPATGEMATMEATTEETATVEATTEEAATVEATIAEVATVEAATEEVVAEETKIPEAPDYTKADSWVLLPEAPDKEVDTFFIYPTIVLQSEYGDFGSIDEAREHSPYVVNNMASIFMDDTNVYMPLYRQITLTKAAMLNKDAYAYKECVYNNYPYEDLKKALDYYFENCNNGRPFILAGHSQGSCLCYLILENYMKEHPEYLERMVATYAIGFGMDEEYYKKNSQLKFAEGETDTGVIISWNTVGPGATGKSMVMPEPCYVINPINWKKDDTYASAAENKGSLVDGKIEMNYADAKINVNRGCVECDTDWAYLEMDAVFGDKCLHGGDFELFYNNTKENVAKRIAAYFSIE